MKIKFNFRRKIVQVGLVGYENSREISRAKAIFLKKIFVVKKCLLFLILGIFAVIKS